MRKYEDFTYIEHNSRLARFFNVIMNKMSTMRMLCAPGNFRKDESIADFQDIKFADFCRYEVWMHSVEDWRW